MSDEATARQAGRKLQKARSAAAAYLDEARQVGLAAIEQGATEKDVALWLGVDRMTVRKWRGKR